MIRLAKIILFCLAFAVLTQTVQAQPVLNFAFAYRIEGDSRTLTLAPNGAIEFPATAAGSTARVTLISNNAAALAMGDTWTIKSMTVTNSRFSAEFGAEATLRPGETNFTNLRFSPAARGPVEGTLTIQFVNVAQGTAGVTMVRTFFLTGTGTTPDFVSSYLVNPGGNQTPVKDADTILFPRADMNQTSAVTFVVLNRGNGPGTVRRATVTGDAFQLSGLPLLPAQLLPERDLRFNIVFSPKTQQRFTGSLRVEYDTGVVTILLEGQGTAATLIYESMIDSQRTAIPANGRITVPDILVGATKSFQVRISNTGNAEGRVAAVSVTGAGFALAEGPTLPVTLGPGGSATLALSFTARESGQSVGRLRIDDTSFELIGVGLGPKLGFAFRLDTTVLQVMNNGTALFPNTNVGSRSEAQFQVTNDGNQPATLSSITLSGSPFSIRALPGLPVTVQPGQTLELGLVFAPDALGAATGTLLIDDLRFNLRGTGNNPPPLPPITLTGLRDTVEPLQQPSVGVSLASPYPLDITGKLTLSFTADSFVDDPATQFSTGGRTIDFRIPANTLEALFGEGGKQAQFQSGTVAGSITVSASLAVSSVNVTPATPPSRSTVITSSEPRLRTVQMGTRTANSFELIITGYSTPRSVTEINVRFTPAPGQNLQTTSLTSNVDTAFSTWYQSATSRSFGSQFSVALIINATGDIGAVQSVTVTATNSRGTSAPASLNLR